MSEWQPIETAPKDGTRILACVAGREGVEIVAHATHKHRGPPWREHYSLGRVCWHQPSHWMPLPTPPVTGKE
jgi:hypothetical protein